MQQFWRRRGPVNAALLPLAALFGGIVFLRRRFYETGIFKSEAAAAPVLVVGNITAGGGGKTPLVISLTQALQQRGFVPGVAARGVGGDFSGVLTVDDNTPWQRCGDEPLLIYRRTGAAVCVSQRRAAAAHMLVRHGCDVIVCDDGLQHYALRRDVEICAVAADLGLGNNWLLPAGPLRESARRLEQCDWILCGGDGDFYHPRALPVMSQNAGFFALGDIRTKLPASFFMGKKVALLAGIAVPQRFFAAVRAAAIVPHSEYPLPDHSRMSDRQLADINAEIILMSEKDAVKYDGADPRLYMLRTTAVLPPAMVAEVLQTVREKIG